MPSLAELLAALPADEQGRPVSTDERFPPDALARLSLHPVPTGAWSRFWKLTGLSAWIGVAYLAYWVRGWFQDAAAKERARMEAHLRAAVRLLETMGYLRGAVMKLGQTAANFPDVVPDEFVETLGRLHCEAPPMHFSLLRELVYSELGGDPEEVFDWFDTSAFAAASLGQVHRARLKTGEDVAVKIQYPGIGRTIRSDFRNLEAFVFPLRLSRDWENLKSQFAEVRRMFEQETDYEQEAGFLRQARALFSEDDGIVVPRVYDEYSTRRVLTMEFLDGLTFYEFLAADPPQHLRDQFGAEISRAIARLLYSGRMEYADPHPGNCLLLEDGRLGLIDFGCMRVFNDEEWEYLRLADVAMRGTRAQVVEAILHGTEFSRDEIESLGILEPMVDYCRWIWAPSVHDGPFDYGDRAHLERGLAIIREFTRRARPRQKAVNVFIQRALLAGAALQYRLRSRVDVKAICDEEVQTTGWRSA